ncbi:hypothetical protein EW146_g8160 [Bondarzewia mesenterica]|uniref:Uncharacterized protein n=1 Tax=Bondarzewia mesenterica TaxID=1095465 RepID=A0A4S4LH98_9AGAM|nr:hypothetical protein EW146_g8160 [Bondarzewia mesenterica]
MPAVLLTAGEVKDSNADGGGGMEVETLEDGTDDKLIGKAQKITIKLPWEITTIFCEVLRRSHHQEDDEEDEDDLEAQEASLERLKVTSTCWLFYKDPNNSCSQEADDVTKQMTHEGYQHYSDCRQASFSYRKAKQF